MNVTKRLFEELELSVLDSFQDPLPDDTTDNVALAAMRRQGATTMVDIILDWAPEGVEGPDDGDLWRI